MSTIVLADESAKATSHPPSTAVLELPQVDIEPLHGWRLINVRELWQYRELLYFLTWRDVKVRYKQTVLGAAWAILQPALMMVVFTVFLGQMAGVTSGDLPYPVFVYAGLLPWTFFATAIGNAAQSVVGSEKLITKIYFPRMAIPMAGVGAAVVDFCVAFSLLVVLMVCYQVTPSVGLLLLPVLFGLLLLAALGVGMLLAALNVAYRDFRYVVPFLIQAWMFATPTIYMQFDMFAKEAPAAVEATATQAQAQVAAVTKPAVSETSARSTLGKIALRLNPLTTLIGTFRAALLGGPIPWPDLGLASLLTVGVFLGGAMYFRRVEDSFADII